MDDPAEALGLALNIAKQINDKVEALTAPLEREMRIMKWPAEYRVIV